MPVAIKKCKVCKREYEACHTNKVSGGFRWQDVACSPECGAIYLARVMEARAPKSEEMTDDTAVQEQDSVSEEEVSDRPAVKAHKPHRKKKK